MEIFKYKYDDLFNPLLSSLQELGGSGSIAEIEDKVANHLKLTEEEMNDIHRGSTTKFSYRLAWARNYLKRYGLIENSARGVWSLTSAGIKHDSVDKQDVKKMVRALSVSDKKKKSNSYNDEEPGWKEELLDVLQKIEPGQFERLCQRMLRELGFVNVIVTGKIGDGGIDGIGVVRMGGVLSFHVVFQCKRYKGSVGASVIRDFRGAMVGRADKGLILTTGYFTSEAKKEAKRDGAPAIDLIDGEEFAYKLMELNLGVETVVVENVIIDRKWFLEF
jgi:restriction system protein